jgi:hypothetical protein
MTLSIDPDQRKFPKRSFDLRTLTVSLPPPNSDKLYPEAVGCRRAASSASAANPQWGSARELARVGVVPNSRHCNCLGRGRGCVLKYLIY